jgi:hypothetical protein
MAKNVNVQKGKKGFQKSTKHASPSLGTSSLQSNKTFKQTKPSTTPQDSIDYNKINETLQSLSHKTSPKQDLRTALKTLPLSSPDIFPSVEAAKGKFAHIPGYDDLRFGGKKSPQDYAKHIARDTWMYRHPEWHATVWRNNSDGSYSVEGTYDRILPASEHTGHTEPGILAYTGSQAKFIPTKTIYDVAYSLKPEDDPSHNYTYERDGKDWIPVSQKVDGKWVPLKNS